MVDMNKLKDSLIKIIVEVNKQRNKSKDKQEKKELYSIQQSLLISLKKIVDFTKEENK